MSRIDPASLMSLEVYARRRDTVRAQMIAHKKLRRAALGPSVSLLFEDEAGVRYQVQEMLRAERIFEDAEVQAELAAYEGLLPDGQNWKATMLIEFPEAAERRVRLQRLTGIEDRVWARVAGFEPVFAVANEGMPPPRADKTAAVHFLRFELGAQRTRALLDEGATLALGIDHPRYTAALDPVPEALRASLCGDLLP